MDGYRCVTTEAVRQELQRGSDNDARIGAALDVPWLEVVDINDLDALYAFAIYMARLGNRRRNAGEASVLVSAEVHDVSAYVDDQVACNVGRQRGVSVRRTLELIIRAYEQGIFFEDRAQKLVTDLVEGDARFPQQAKEDLSEGLELRGSCDRRRRRK